jgi:hypothetical protein
MAIRPTTERIPAADATRAVTSGKSLGRPDVLLQPGHQRQVVGEPAQQRHRRVGVRIDQTRQQGVLGEIDSGVGLEARLGLFSRQQRDDASIGNGDGVIFEQHAARLDRYDPAGTEQGIDRLHREGSRPERVDCCMRTGGRPAVRRGYQGIVKPTIGVWPSSAGGLIHRLVLRGSKPSCPTSRSNVAQPPDRRANVRKRAKMTRWPVTGENMACDSVNPTPPR